jgi:2-polyprenyl-3-methyl-5-hydroxy-6-metoxy-1,4-benzoquinol methylase
VLEIGCSDGVFTHRLAQSCRTVVAVDISSVACQLAQERCADDKNVTIRQMDIEREELPGVFDSVFMMDVLHFFSGRERLTNVSTKAIQAVAPGGFLIFTEHRVPDVQRDAWWQKALPYGADAYLQLFAKRPELELVWSRSHEPADERYTPHLLAIYRKRLA